ncbi:PREDICTED: uncharacterized protein LOC109474101 [Branchiostoma belcheri]|uniref:Uncharacterized protein LOC109474101 n=1 Tax=Branchiostoma belcheri TaxID=7741 RepID=A0A6P4ZFJ6_BRABE|nr:PREDICTED: uncharacterized protein LOC109474101 [Branchiostoma belcheri]
MMMPNISDDDRLAQRRAPVDCDRQVCCEGTDHVYLEPRVIILPRNKQFSHSGEKQQQRLQQPHDHRHPHLYEDAEPVVHSSTSRGFSHSGEESDSSQRKDDPSFQGVYCKAEPVSFPLQDFNVTICGPGASTTETSFSNSPEEVHDEAHPVHQQGHGMPSARDDGVPADSDSISKNEEQEILCDQRCHITSRVHRACVARTTVVIATLIITGVALLLSVSSWHKKEDDVTAVLLLSTQGSINTSVTLGDSRSVTEAMTDPEIASQELSTSFMKMKTDEASTSTTPRE